MLKSIISLPKLETGGYKLTNWRRHVLNSGQLMLYWFYLLAYVSALGSWPFPIFFFFRKTSSWLCVWNYTSKQGRHTENKTAVRQWITVLWPDKSWGVDEKVGKHQESHIHTLSSAYIHSHCMHVLHLYHNDHEATHIDKLIYELHLLFLLGINSVIPAIFHIFIFQCQIFYWANINSTESPTGYIHQNVLCYS